jgi:hypothetical protein
MILSSIRDSLRDITRIRLAGRRVGRLSKGGDALTTNERGDGGWRARPPSFDPPPKAGRRLKPLHKGDAAGVFDALHEQPEVFCEDCERPHLVPEPNLVNLVHAAVARREVSLNDLDRRDGRQRLRGDGGNRLLLQSRVVVVRVLPHTRRRELGLVEWLA